ncbi:putative uncharacterized protein DDB_G0271606 [Drosophila busckii]|uniref:putative uncharacterized protein DDB_G0271606 n=1 Tax=Drosophila busckii TaxID=30019 RepID=UPI001432C862|nr:putative uncharacterized protein DDB_G0271606 [Drosophila busckii]
MRSRTELVTTTFDLDSDEEDYSDDDSEEDWRPSTKRTLKPQASRANAHAADVGGGGRKRKASTTSGKTKARRVAPSKTDAGDFESDDDFILVDDDSESEESDDEFDAEPVASTSSKRGTQSLPPKKQFAKLTQLDLLLKKQELLSKDWLQNSRLCLWRRDEETNLLQKYLRVKTLQNADRPHEHHLLFTSSSVYSSWDEQDLSAFIEVKVNCLDSNNRRIELVDLEALNKLSLELQQADESHQNTEQTDENDNNEDTTDQEPGQEQAQVLAQESAQEPGQEQAQEPGQEQAQEPPQEVALEPAREAAPDSVQKQAQEPGQEQAQKPAQEPGQEQAQETPQDSAVKSAQESTQEIVQAPAQENS